MAEPKQLKAIKGGLNITKRLLADTEEAGLTAAQRAEAGRKAAALIKSQPQVKASEALGQQMEKGMKRTTTTQADRTRVGGGNIGGAPFSAISEADPAYAGKVWGVMDEGTAARLKNLTDPETAWTTMLGSASQLKTNPIVFDKLKRGFVDSMKQGNLSPELAGKINHNLELTFGAGADIRDPKIWQQADTFEKRAALADVMMGQGITPKKGGVAIGGEKSGKGVIFRPTDILKRETEPTLLHTEHGGDVPTFAAGPRLFKLEKESVYRPDLHPGFPTLLTGKDLDVNMIPTPTEIYLPDWHKQFKKNNPNRKPGYYDLALGVKGEGLPSQDLNDEYIRHLLREGFKDGGEVDQPSLEDRLTKAIANDMASGGEVNSLESRLTNAIAQHNGMAEGGGAFKKIQFMEKGGKAGKLVSGIAKVGKRLMSEEQVASDAIGKAAQSAGMNAPVTATKPLTTVQDFHTSFGDSVRKRAMDMQATMDSLNYKYDKGQRVFTEDSARKNWPPMTVLGRVLEGNRIMREDPTDFLSKKIIDEATGKAKRTPYEAGYKVRLEHAPDNWSEFVIPESAIKGNVDMARGGLAYMDKGGKAGKLASGVANIGKRLLADAPVEPQTAKTNKRLLLGEILPAPEREENLRKMLETSKIKERLYHATPEDVKFFKPGGLNPKVSGEAIWLSNDPTRTPAAHNIGTYANPKSGVNVMPVHVQAKNPMMLDDETMLKWAREVYGEGSAEFPYLMPKKWRDEVMKDYDSIILADPYKRGDSHEIIMFEPEKIKSAIGNRGTYNTDTADITKAQGGIAHMDKGGKAGKLASGLASVSKRLLADAPVESPAAKQMRLNNMPTARIGLEAPGILIPSKMNNVREAVRNMKGNYGARRVERAADEIPNLEKMYQEDALKEAFTGDNASAMITLNPAEFERYAIELQKRREVGPKMAELAKQGDIDKMTVPTDEYIQHLQRLQDGFSDVPYLNLFKDEVGLPIKPSVIGHEGRHRSRALSESGAPRSLVKINPRGDLREGMPRRTQDDFIEALKEELELSNRLVLPEVDGSYRRPAIELPDVYAKGGLTMAGGGSIQDNLKNIQNYSVLDQGATRKPNELGGVVLAGASWMAGDEKTRLAKQLFGDDVTNTAIGGQKTSDVLNQLNVFERDGGTFAPDTTVVLDIGANDIAQGVDEETIRNNLNEIVSRLGEKGVHVILSGQPEAHSYDEAIARTDLRMDDLYNDIAANNPNVTLVDAMSDMLNQKDLMDESRFHLNSDEAKLSYLSKFADAYKSREDDSQTTLDIPQQIEQITQTSKPEERYTPETQINFAPEVIQPVSEPSAGYTYAQNNSGIDNYYNIINDYLAQEHTQDEIQAAMEQYGVSQADIDAARDYQPSGGRIDESYATEAYANGGSAFKKIQFMDKGGITTSAGSFSPEELGVTANDLRVMDEKTWNNIKRNAPATYEWAKQNVKDEASQLKTAKGAKDFALRVGASYAGAIPDFANLLLMAPDAIFGTELASEKPWFGSQQYLDAMNKAGMLGENEFPIAETVAGILTPAGLIKKGVKKVGNMRTSKETPKKRQGGLTAMAR